MKKAICFVTTLVLATGIVCADPKGDDIARKYFALSKTQDSTAKATLVIIDKSGSKKTRQADMFTRETSDGKSSFITFTQPADVAGTKFLTIPHKGADSDQRLYLPALKKVRKIASGSKDGEFVNSDFFFYDMESREFGDYTYTFISEGETLADKAFAGMTFFKVEMKPKAVDTPYSKSVVWINADNYFVYRMDCYAAKDKSLWKTITFPKVELIKGVLVPTQTMVSNVKKGSKSLMQLSDLKVNTGVSADTFSVQNLEK